MNDNNKEKMIYEVPSLEELYVSPVIVKGESGENEDETVESNLKEMGEGQDAL